MIRLLNAQSGGGVVLRSVDEVAPHVVPHLAAAVSPQTLGRFKVAARAIGQRWGAAAASSLLARLEPHSQAPDFIISVVAHGPVAWVISGNGMMRPFLPWTWFVVGETWQALSPDQGVPIQIRAAPDACLAHPREVFDAVAAAMTARFYPTPQALLAFHPDADEALQALAVAPRAEGRTLVALGWYAGCLGPIALEVDTAEATLHPRRQDPWRPQALR